MRYLILLLLYTSLLQVGAYYYPRLYSLPFTSLSSDSSCGYQIRHVCWNVSESQTRCTFCYNTRYPLSNMIGGTSDVWVSDGADEEATLYLNVYGRHQIFWISLNFASILPREISIESYNAATYRYSVERYFAANCSLLSPCKRQKCNGYNNEHSINLYLSRYGIQTTRFRIIMQSHLKSNQNSYYSHALENVAVSGYCNCFGHRCHFATLDNPNYCSTAAEQNLRIAPISPTVLQVSWDPPRFESLPTKYQLCTRTTPDAPCSVLFLEGGKTAANISNLDPGTTYYVSVTPYLGKRPGIEYKQASAKISELCTCKTV